MFATISCSSSDVVQNLSAEDRFELGKKKFDEGDYLDAIQDFQAITTQYPGSSVADDAQYYLGESRFLRGEYLLAVYEYETLKKNMPASSYFALTLYKIGLCYYELSPKSPLDQNYTKKGIDEFQNFLEYFPTHELAQDAEAKIHHLNNRLAKKDYDTAILYMKMENYKAADFYFNSVLEKFHDTEYAERAHLGKIETMIARKKYQDAQVEIEKFLSKYPTSEYKDRVKSIENFINDQGKDQSVMNNVSDRPLWSSVAFSIR
jgi:outer membrane protein assembly factor BamD